jgi:hypothetical protein
MAKQQSLSGESNPSSVSDIRNNDLHEINVDLNELFDYSLDGEGTAPSPASHSMPLISSENQSIPFQPQLNNFEKLLQSDQQMINGLLVPTQPSQDNQRQQKNYFHDLNHDQHDYSAYFMTTQIDTPLSALRSPRDLTRADFLSLIDLHDSHDPLFPLEEAELEQQSTDWSLQTCVGMVFGLKLNDLTQRGGFLPPLSTSNSQFERQLDQWLSAYTTCTSHLIPYNLFLDLSVDLQGEMLCIVYGMPKSSSTKRCLVGALEMKQFSSMTTSTSPPLKCLLDPADPHCIEGHHPLLQNQISLDQIDWILYFTESTTPPPISSTSSFLEQRQRLTNHHTEILSLEESGLYTQEEEPEEEEEGVEQKSSSHAKNTDSYLRLAQSTVEHEPLSETPIEEQSFVMKKSIPPQKHIVIEEPTEIVPTDEMARYLNDENNQTSLSSAHDIDGMSFLVISPSLTVDR